MTKASFVLGTPFKPHPSLVTWFVINFLLFVLLLLSCSYLPVAVFSGIDPIVNLVVLILLVVLIAVFVLWVRLYYESMWYELREDEISWKRGVWFRTTGIVPYNRIVNLDLRQGPLMRFLGISTLAIQTAGYSGQAVPEIKIEGIEHAEELRELIRSHVRGSLSDEDGTGSAKPLSSPSGVSVHQQMLEELQQIRSLLEQKR